MKLKTFLIVFFLAFISVYALTGLYLRNHPRYVPQIVKEDLSPLLGKNTFTESDYILLFDQTGLTAPLIDEMRTLPDFNEKILLFQENYLKEVPVISEYLPPITYTISTFHICGCLELLQRILCVTDPQHRKTKD